MVLGNKTISEGALECGRPSRGTTSTMLMPPPAPRQPAPASPSEALITRQMYRVPRQKQMYMAPSGAPAGYRASLDALAPGTGVAPHPCHNACKSCTACMPQLLHSASLRGTVAVVFYIKCKTWEVLCITWPAGSQSLAPHMSWVMLVHVW